jgi:hypothetical protein
MAEMGVQRNRRGGEDLIDLAQDTDNSWAFVNRVMKLRVP